MLFFFRLESRIFFLALKEQILNCNSSVSFLGLVSSENNTPEFVRGFYFKSKAHLCNYLGLTRKQDSFKAEF